MATVMCQRRQFAGTNTAKLLRSLTTAPHEETQNNGTKRN